MSWTAKLTLLEKPPHHVVARFWATTDQESSDCILWLGTKSYDGYGKFHFKKKSWMAHRFIYEVTNGPAPLDQTVDHECRVRHCVNPKHLRLLTNKKNVLIGDGLTAREALQTHCRLGHPFEGNNLRYEKTWRRCKRCHNDRQKKYRKARRALEFIAKNENQVKDQSIFARAAQRKAWV